MGEPIGPNQGMDHHVGEPMGMRHQSGRTNRAQIWGWSTKVGEPIGPKSGDGPPVEKPIGPNLGVEHQSGRTNGPGPAHGAPKWENQYGQG